MKDQIIERDAKRYDELLTGERGRFDGILQKAFVLAEKLQLTGGQASDEENRGRADEKIRIPSKKTASDFADSAEAAATELGVPKKETTTIGR